MASYIIEDSPGKRYLLMGNEAIARGAIEGGVQVAAAYPGTPSSEILETLTAVAKDLGIHAEWSINEKVAFNVAAGAAIVGARALFACKNAGLNWAMDDFVTLAYTGIRGGFVIVVADDPNAHYSSTEQDTRMLAMHAGVPILEPMDAHEAKEMTKEAFDISEKLQLPVFLRSVTRIGHASGDVTYGEIRRVKNKIAFDKHWGLPFRWDVYGPPGPVGKREWQFEQLKKAEELVEDLRFNQLKINGDNLPGIISSGIANSYVMDALKKLNLSDKMNFLKIGTPFPLPKKKLKALLEKSSKVMVVEEGDPVVEMQARAYAQELKLTIEIVGKMYDDNVLPKCGELSPDMVNEAIANFAGIKISKDNKRSEIKKEVSKLIAPRSSMWCAGCPHLGTFWALRRALIKKKAKVPIINVGIGCYEMSGYGVYGREIKAEYTEESKGYPIATIYPYEMSDVEYVMGTEWGMVQGEYQAGYKDGPIIGITGDSSFFHANIPNLANAVYNNVKAILLVLDNHWTAMTGHQPNPSTDKLLGAAPANVLSMEDVIKAIGVKFVRVVDPYNLEECEKSLLEALDYDGLSVIIFRRECALQALRHKRLIPTKYVVSEDKCIGCRQCVMLGCPAIGFNFDKKKAFIDPLLCVGCNICAQVCPSNAIHKAGDE